MAKNSGINALKNLKNKISGKIPAVTPQPAVVTKKPEAAASVRAAARSEYLEDTPKSPAKAENLVASELHRADRKKKRGLFWSPPEAEFSFSRLARKRKGIFGRALWFSSLFPFKRNAAARAKDDALAFAENGRRLSRRARRNRRIFLYAGTGVAVIAVMLIVFLAPGGVAAPAEATKGASPVPQPTVLSAAGGLPIPAITATPTPAASVTPFAAASPTQMATATPASTPEPTPTQEPTPTPEPTPSPTPVPTTPPEPTPKPVDLNKLVKFFVVEADKYYNEMGYSNNHYDYTDEEKYMLAQVIDAEARGESMEGKIAVGNVVMNRVLCRSFPGNTIKEVVTRPGQFAYNPNRKPTSASKRAAAAVLDDEKWVVAQDVYYFRSGVEAGADWGSHKFYKKIGGHCFYRHSYSGRHRGGDPPPALFERTFKYVQYGCKKADRVKRIQYMLNKLGYDVKADGYFGLTSKQELMKFQEDKGLEADGVAGPATIKALIKAFGVDKYIKKWGA